MAYIIELLDSVNKKYEEYLASQEPNINLLNLWKARDENSHSKMIKTLLHPKGSHKQGTKFLKSFLEIIMENISITEEQLKEVTVKAEKHRIDISLYLKNDFFIIIENKLDAGDQSNQLVRYYEHIKGDNTYKVKDNQIYLIYLTLDGHAPSDTSLTYPNKKETIPLERVNCISYGNEILEWLGQCIKDVSSDKEASLPSLLSSALIQYKDTIEELTGKKNGRKNMREKIVNEIVHHFLSESNKNINEIAVLIESLEISQFIFKSLSWIKAYNDRDGFALYYGSFKRGEHSAVSFEELFEKLNKLPKSNSESTESVQPYAFQLKGKDNRMVTVEFLPFGIPKKPIYKITVGILNELVLRNKNQETFRAPQSIWQEKACFEVSSKWKDKLKSYLDKE
ncbi:MAG: PD-(D/E)XK nuclease family protein [Brevinema sp.]